ncbi:MAG: YSC84-related protein [Spirochaetia bacterium]|jgi:lipid-binding SYLF domain-containing protein|nr:YSC84-related protein [Spirochaetia bacterium]
MRIKSFILISACILILAAPLSAESDKSTDAEEDRKAMEEFLRSDIVADFHKSAYAYAVFPTIGKGGLGLGGAHGTGRVYLDGKVTGEVSMTQVSIGFQAGGQTYRQVIFLKDERAYDDFTSGSFEFSAQAQAIAITSSAGMSMGTEGQSASADSSQAENDYYKGMIVFTMGKKGLMLQAAIGGQKYKFKKID